MDTPEQVDGDELSGRSRRWARTFFLAFLALQLAVPLTYYLRDDPYDERFAWRMFSNVRLHRCRTSVTERSAETGTRSLDLYRTVEVRWTRLLSRNRATVIEGFLEWRCGADELNIEEVALVNRCATPANEPLAPQRYTRDCRSGVTTFPDAPLSLREPANAGVETP